MDVMSPGVDKIGSVQTLDSVPNVRLGNDDFLKGESFASGGGLGSTGMGNVVDSAETATGSVKLLGCLFLNNVVKFAMTQLVNAKGVFLDRLVDLKQEKSNQ
eukprot:CAMPEP_0116081020 /NCGR_PEP_ID=MMETSP0327-20121206/1981_1 /TAXON_ID=44447 /ORGANISM="Pseudo-nitzschia delicatissima, Strain B596" /LENGTH=101 /DNA_ID=CAMNT_0003571741 /DNA_START=202 /DNA_END=507 /DNA_ORIENTATION=+